MRASACWRARDRCSETPKTRKSAIWLATFPPPPWRGETGRQRHCLPPYIVHTSARHLPTHSVTCSDSLEGVLSHRRQPIKPAMACTTACISGISTLASSRRSAAPAAAAHARPAASLVRLQQRSRAQGGARRLSARRHSTCVRAVLDATEANFEEEVLKVLSVGLGD
jgi:hypothetical protein